MLCSGHILFRVYHITVALFSLTGEGWVGALFWTHPIQGLSYHCSFVFPEGGGLGWCFVLDTSYFPEGGGLGWCFVLDTSHSRFTISL